MIKRFTPILLVAIVFTSCVNAQSDPIKYLALGDSYTIGESIAEDGRWPIQLAMSLEERGVKTDVEIVAKTGWRTDDLLSAIEENNLPEDYDLVSLLIGVNNQYQDKHFSQYEVEFEILLNKALEHALGDTARLFVVSIPDYYYTPFGQGQKTAKVSLQLDQYNAFARNMCLKWGIPFYDITSISRRGIDEANLVAEDGLHPSALQYQLWVELIMKDFTILIKE